MVSPTYQWKKWMNIDLIFSRQSDKCHLLYQAHLTTLISYFSPVYWVSTIKYSDMSQPGRVQLLTEVLQPQTSVLYLLFSCCFETRSTLWLFFLNDATPSIRPKPTHYRGFTITPRHNTFGRTSLAEWSARRRDLYRTTHKLKTDRSPYTRGIQTRIPSKRATTDPRLRPRDHCDKQLINVWC